MPKETARGSKSQDSYQAIKAWEKYWHKQVPKGYVVHHKDGNPENNAISNLKLMSRASSNRIHKKGKTLREQKNATDNKPNVGTEDGPQRRFR